MGRLLIMLLASALAWPCPALTADSPPTEAPAMARTRMTLEQRVGSEVYRQAGLHKLSPEEQWALAEWLGQYTRQITAYVEEQCRRPDGAPPKP